MDNITIYTTFFPQNKYASWYINIIHNRLMNPLLENGEFHHIIPNCFYNIDNFNLPHTKTDNDYNHKVKLSYREHFICHFLLWKMFPYKSIQRQKLAYAFSMMRCNSGNRHTSYSYKYAKKALIEASSMRTGNNNSMYGKKHSDETKQLIRERKLGKPLSQSHRDNISKSCAGRAFTQAHRDNLSNSHKDKQFSKSHRDNISKSRSSTLYVSNDTLRITKYINKTELDTYIANGYIDIIKTETLIKNKIHGNRVFPFLTKDFNSDIDTLDDFENFEKILKNNVNFKKYFFYSRNRY